MSRTDDIEDKTFRRYIKFRAMAEHAGTDPASRKAARLRAEKIEAVYPEIKAKLRKRLAREQEVHRRTQAKQQAARDIHASGKPSWMVEKRAPSLEELIVLWRGSANALDADAGLFERLMRMGMDKAATWLEQMEQSEIDEVIDNIVEESKMPKARLTWRDRFDEEVALEIEDAEDDEGTPYAVFTIELPQVMWQEVVTGKGTAKKLIDWMQDQYLSAEEDEDDDQDDAA